LKLDNYTIEGPRDEQDHSYQGIIQETDGKLKAAQLEAEKSFGVSEASKQERNLNNEYYFLDRL